MIENKKKQRNLLGLSDNAEYSCATVRTFALHCVHAVLHRDSLAVLNFNALFALHASSFNHFRYTPCVFISLTGLAEPFDSASIGHFLKKSYLKVVIEHSESDIFSI